MVLSVLSAKAGKSHRRWKKARADICLKTGNFDKSLGWEKGIPGKRNNFIY